MRPEVLPKQGGFEVEALPKPLLFGISGLPKRCSFGKLSFQMTTPIEAKWVTTGWRSDAKTIEGKFARGVVATRTITNLQHRSWAMPAPVVALLLN